MARELPELPVVVGCEPTQVTETTSLTGAFTCGRATRRVRASESARIRKKVDGGDPNTARNAICSRRSDTPAARHRPKLEGNQSPISSENSIAALTSRWLLSLPEDAIEPEC